MDNIIMGEEEFFCVNMKDYLIPDPADGIGENELNHILSDFSCTKNADVETFLLKNAVEFTKKNQSITYLVFSNVSMDLVGYFSLTVKPVTIQTEGLSNSAKKKLGRLSRYDEKEAGYHVAAYLIAQLGRNFSPNVTHPITGKRLMTLALQTLQEIQYDLGGLIVYLECEDREALLQFYQEQNGFRRFGERITENPGETEPHRLIQLMNFL